MSDLARPRSRSRTACDLNRILRRAGEMMRYDERARRSEIVYELDEALPAVPAVEEEMMQVFLNLALNAFDAMDANPPESTRRLVLRSERRGEGVRVTFRDTGPGVPAEAREHLFQPFFTTKPAGRGSGLGLSVSYRILEEHGGVLRLDAEAREGAAFVLEIPGENAQVER